MYVCKFMCWCGYICVCVIPNPFMLLQAGVNDKVSHDMAEKILIDLGEFFQVQVSHISIN